MTLVFFQKTNYFVEHSNVNSVSAPGRFSMTLYKIDDIIVLYCTRIVAYQMLERMHSGSK